MKAGIIGLFVAVSGTLVLSSCSSEEIKEEKEVVLKPLVTVANVQEKAFHHEIRVQGNIETDQDVTLSAEMGGLITSINVKEGQTVRKGQVVARVDASVLSSNVNELKTQLEYAEYMLEKQEELQKRGVGSEFDLETAKSQVNSIMASVRSLNTQRGKAVIRAPFTGIVDEVFARQGQMAGPSSPIARLVNSSSIDIVAAISEKHFTNVKVGTDINVSFPNYSDTVVKLKITNVGNYIQPTNRTFRIISEIDNNTFFLPNMLAQVSITDFSVDNGLVVPSTSVLKDRNNQDYIFVALPTKEKDHFKVNVVSVKVINKFDGETLITSQSELTSKTVIIVNGAKGIADQDIVRINSDEDKKK